MLSILLSLCCCASITGGVEWNGFHFSFDSYQSEVAANFDLRLESAVHRIDRANFGLTESYPKRDDGLAGFLVNFSLGGAVNPPLNSQSYDWSLVYPAVAEPIVTLSSGLSWSSHEEDGVTTILNYGYASGDLRGAIWDEGALVNYREWPSDFDGQRYFNWSGSIPGHFLTTEFGRAVFAPEPVTLVLLGCGLPLCRRRRLSVLVTVGLLAVGPTVQATNMTQASGFDGHSAWFSLTGDVATDSTNESFSTWLGDDGVTNWGLSLGAAGHYGSAIFPEPFATGEFGCLPLHLTWNTSVSGSWYTAVTVVGGRILNQHAVFGPLENGDGWRAGVYLTGIVAPEPVTVVLFGTSAAFLFSRRRK